MIESKGTEPPRNGPEIRPAWIHESCWLRFGRAEVGIEWIIGQIKFWLSVEITAEHYTLAICLPLVSVFFRINSDWPPLYALLPKARLKMYPDTECIDERRIRIAIHHWRLYVNPYSRRRDYRPEDPWWVRGVSLGLNPFSAARTKERKTGGKPE